MKSRCKNRKSNIKDKKNQTSDNTLSLDEKSVTNCIVDDANKTDKTEADSAKDVFNESLDLLSEENIPDNGRGTSKNRRFDLLSAVSLVICISICAITTFMLVDNIYGKYKGEKLYDSAADKFNDIGIGYSADPDKEIGVENLSKDRKPVYTLTMDQIIAGSITGVEQEYGEELAKMRASLTSLAQINPDIYGWIRAEGTTINYPIVRGEDNEYYLDHAYTGDNLPIGSIFADFRALDSVEDNRNTVLYGHNITTGSMFNNVQCFFEDEYFFEKKIYLYTLDGVFVYEPFSIYETSYDSGYVQMNFQSDEEYMSFLKQIEKSSQMPDKGYDITPETKILTLSTCTNGAMTARYAFHAILVSSITD